MPFTGENFLENLKCFFSVRLKIENRHVQLQVHIFVNFIEMMFDFVCKSLLW